MISSLFHSNVYFPYLSDSLSLPIPSSISFCQSGPWNLGAFSPLIGVLALFWLALVVVVLCLPSGTHTNTNRIWYSFSVFLFLLLSVFLFLFLFLFPFLFLFLSISVCGFHKLFVVYTKTFYTSSTFLVWVWSGERMRIISASWCGRNKTVST